MGLFLQITSVSSTVAQKLKRQKKNEKKSYVMAKRRTPMVQTSVKSYQEEQHSLWGRLIQCTGLLVAGLFLAILVTAFTPGLSNTVHAASIETESEPTATVGHSGNIVQPTGVIWHGKGNIVQPTGVVGHHGSTALSTGIVGRGSLIQQTAAVYHAGGNVVQQIIIAKATNGVVIQKVINIFLVVYRR
jgi:hypothetical protein